MSNFGVINLSNVTKAIASFEHTLISGISPDDRAQHGASVGHGAYPKENPGGREFTLRAEAEGKFQVPSLRNIALTAPYMHDGSIATLEAVVDHYVARGWPISTGPNKGPGADHQNRSDFINGFGVTPQEKRDMVSFLKALTDSAFIRDKRFSNPCSDTLTSARARSSSSTQTPQ